MKINSSTRAGIIQLKYSKKSARLGRFSRRGKFSRVVHSRGRQSESLSPVRAWHGVAHEFWKPPPRQQQRVLLISCHDTRRGNNCTGRDNDPDNEGLLVNTSKARLY